MITPPEGVAQYLQALQKAAPTKTRLIQYATTWEGRPLWLFVIGSPDRIAKLDQVKADIQRFADPRRTPAADGDRLARELPVVVWLVHGVHGNEISSADAALVEAYHLLASQGDAGVDAVLRDALVLIDPMQNPDGRARFIARTRRAARWPPIPTPYSAEHDEPWPGGRSNHYLFDMNRDWFAQSQPETRGRIKIGLEFQPQVTVDLHEQGGDNAYYFAPPAEAINPHVTKSQIAGWDLFGRANAARFDERGWAYYIREVYDAFYPGYGDSWPTFQGSIGMTYEQASARGLAFARSDGDTLTYRDGVMHHFNAAIVTAITAARNRERLMRELSRVPPQRGCRRREGPDPRIRARARTGSVARRSAGAQSRDAGHRGAPRRGADQARRAHDARRRLPRVERAADRAHDSQPARSEDRAVGRVHQAAGRAPQDAAQRSDLRHHRVEPADAVRRGAGDEPDGDRREDERRCRRSTTRRSRCVRSPRRRSAT